MATHSTSSKLPTIFPSFLFPKLNGSFPCQKDDSDFQYRSFRDYVGLLTIIMFLYLSISKLVSNLPSSRRSYRPLSQSQSQSSNSTTSTLPSAQNPNRIPFLLIFIAIFVIVLHGTNTLKILLILSINYFITKTFGGNSITPILIWVFNCAVLGSVHWNDGFSWNRSLPFLGFFVSKPVFSLTSILFL